MIDKNAIDALGFYLESLNNPQRVEQFCRTHKFEGMLEGVQYIGGTGCNRLALGNSRVILKVVREPRAIYQNKFEVWLMENCKSEQLKRHMPELYAYSKNYFITVTRRLSHAISPDKDMLNSEDYKIFKSLGLGDDIHNNNTWWDSERGTWVIVDLGIPSSSEFCQAAINNLKNGNHIKHNFKIDYARDMCR